MATRFPLLILLVLGLMGLSTSWAQGPLERLEAQLGEPLPAVPQSAPQDQPLDNTLPPVPGLPPGLEATESEPGYLGLVVDETVPGEAGPRVVTVRAGSPSAAAGIQRGDLILAIGEKQITKLDDLDAVLSRALAGQILNISLERNGQALIAEAKLTTRAAVDPNKQLPPVLPSEPAGQPLVPAEGRASLGVTVAPLTEQTQREYRIPVARGALVTVVSPGSPAQEAGLRVGNTIVAMEGRLIESSETLVEMIRNCRPGQEVELTYYQGEQLHRKAIKLSTAQSSILMPREPIPASEPTLPPTGGVAGGGILGGQRGGDRPLLRTLEKVLEGVNAQGGGIAPGNLIPGGLGGLAPGGVIPGGAPAAGTPPPTIARPVDPGFAPATPSTETADSHAASARELQELKLQVQTLQAQIERLESVLRTLEERLPK